MVSEIFYLGIIIQSAGGIINCHSSELEHIYRFPVIIGD